MIQLITLGRLALTDGPNTLLPGRRKLLALLAYLSRQSDSAVGRDQLASLLWSDVDEARARRSLRTAIAELRAALPGVLESSDDELHLVPGAIELDASSFEAQIAQGNYEAAIVRWEGDFLEGLDDLGDEEWRFWLETDRARLRTQLAFALERLCASSQSNGRSGDLVRYAERWVQVFPADERAATQLIIALRSAGRDSEAAARHTELYRRLEDLNGAPPSAAFARLNASRRDEGRSPGVRGLLTPELVGRETSLSMLMAAWRGAQRGEAHCIFVEGNDGLGKTRLLEEFARQARGAAGQKTVIVARAFASEQARSRATVRIVLDQLADAPGISASPPEVIASLGSASPAIRERFPNATGGTLELGDAASRALADVAFEAPIVLILDDAPAADPESMAVIDVLARRAPPRALLVLSGTAESWNAIAAIDELRRLPHASRITLSPLTADETRRVVQSVVPMGEADLQALADRIHADAGGRPGMTQQLLRLLVDRGTIVPDAPGRWRLSADVSTLELPVPGEVGDDMRTRISVLSPDASRVLEAAAVIAPRIDSELLERVSGLSANAYRGAVADLLARRLLRNSGATDGAMEFTGEAERRAAYMCIAPSTRRSLHRAAARAIRADQPDEVRRALAKEHRRLGGVDPRRRIAVVVGAAVIALAAVAGAYGIIGAGAVPAGAPVLLASVQNLTSDSTLGRTLDIPVRIALQESRRVTLLPARQVNDVLVRMRKSMPPAGLDEGLAQEIAVRENLPAFIHISISAIDTTFRITGRIIEPDNGRDLYSAQVNAEGRSAILPALDDVVKKLRTALGESRIAVRGVEQSLPRMTTSSLDALRFYSAGRQEWLKLQFPAAKEYWMRAVQLDTAFALAWAAIADFYYTFGDAGIDFEAGSRYHDKALSHADRLSERERMTLLASVASRRKRGDEVIERYRLLAERYPDRDSWYSYGSTLMRQGQSARAIPVLRRTVELDSMFTFGWVNLATSYHIQKQLDSSLAAYDRAARTGEFVSRGGNVNQEWGGTLLEAGQNAKAESIYVAATEKGETIDRALAFRSLGLLGIFEGRYRFAAAQLERAVALAEQSNSALSSGRSQWMQGMAVLMAGDTVLARRHLDRGEKLLGDLATDPVFPFYLADLQLRAGNSASARRLLPRIEKGVAASNPEDRSIAIMIHAELAFQAGQLDSATAESRRVELESLSGYRDALLSDIHEQRGQLDSALAAAQRLEAKWQYGYEVLPLWRHAPLRVARIALRIGDTALARQKLERQLDIWKRADLEFPDLLSARRMLADLNRKR